MDYQMQVQCMTFDLDQQQFLNPHSLVVLDKIGDCHGLTLTEVRWSVSKYAGDLCSTHCKEQVHKSDMFTQTTKRKIAFIILFLLIKHAVNKRHSSFVLIIFYFNSQTQN